jgi:hypothetical protein
MPHQLVRNRPIRQKADCNGSVFQNGFVTHPDQLLDEAVGGIRLDLVLGFVAGASGSFHGADKFRSCGLDFVGLLK